MWMVGTAQDTRPRIPSKRAISVSDRNKVVDTGAPGAGYYNMTDTLKPLVVFFTLLVLVWLTILFGIRYMELHATPRRAAPVALPGNEPWTPTPRFRDEGPRHPMAPVQMMPEFLRP